MVKFRAAALGQVVWLSRQPAAKSPAPPLQVFKALSANWNELPRFLAQFGLDERNLHHWQCGLKLLVRAERIVEEPVLTVDF